MVEDQVEDDKIKILIMISVNMHFKYFATQSFKMKSYIHIS